MVPLVACSPNQIDGIWPIVKPLLQLSFIKSATNIPETLTEDLKSGRRVLWLLLNPEDLTHVLAAGITAMFDMRDGKMCKIEHLAGTGLHLWRGQRSVIEDYAKANGCDRVMCEGPRGWLRVLDDYKLTAVILEKRL